MTKRNAMKWVNALRSGKYRQGDPGKLKKYHHETKTYTYCCLGVLDQIFPKLDLAGHHSTVLLNHGRIGLETSSGFIGREYCFSGLNDGSYCYFRAEVNIPEGDRLTFNEIADIIQLEYVEGI